MRNIVRTPIAAGNRKKHRWQRSPTFPCQNSRLIQRDLPETKNDLSNASAPREVQSICIRNILGVNPHRHSHESHALCTAHQFGCGAIRAMVPVRTRPSDPEVPNRETCPRNKPRLPTTTTNHLPFSRAVKCVNDGHKKPLHSGSDLRRPPGPPLASAGRKTMPAASSAACRRQIFPA